MNVAAKSHIWQILLILCLSAIVVLILLNADTTTLQKIQRRGELMVLTRNAPTTYYEGLDGKTGFEYDLAQQFADELNVELRLIIPDGFNDILPMINGGQADLIAAALTVTAARKNLIRFGPPYQEITQQLIYDSSRRQRPKNINAIIGRGRLEIVAGSSFEERLLALQLEHPELSWVSTETLDSEQLLDKLAAQEIDYTIIDSNEFELSRRFYPELRAAFDIGEPQQLAWGFRQDAKDDSLYQAATAFFQRIENDGTLTELLERHYSYARQFKPVDTTLFLRHVRERLPPYRYMFAEAGAEHGFDWRLLAALAYQESHWITNAVSPTGVRGMMMLTERTAGQLQVRNRLDARESIMGGARYLQMLRERLPADILPPDRTWMALAAYNVGAGHLEDARKITEAQGGDPHKWTDVEKHLPLLSQPAWYRKTRYGYARGREPVVYVRNIRSYYDILVWLDERQQTQPESSPSPPVSQPPAIVPQSL